MKKRWIAIALVAATLVAGYRYRTAARRPTHVGARDVVAGTTRPPPPPTLPVPETRDEHGYVMLDTPPATIEVAEPH